MRLFQQVLSEEEKKRIHEQSIKILEEVGVKFPLEEVLTLLEQKGAKVDWDKEIAYISREMVKDALDNAPKEFILGARNRSHDVKLPNRDTVYTMDGGGMYTYDYDTRKRRTSTTQDLINAGRIFNEIERAKVMWPCVAMDDVNPAGEAVAEDAVLFKHCEKHLQSESLDPKESAYIVQLMKAMLGDIEEVKKRKLFSVVYCTLPPLCHSTELMEGTMEFCKYDLPIVALPMAASGSTGPASLFSNVALTNAEILSTYVLFQAVKPGVPIIYGAASGATDRRSGLFLAGAAETVVQETALHEMGAWYGFPTQMSGCTTEAKEPGMQTIMEKVISSLPLMMAGVNVFLGIGLFETAMTLSLEQMLIDEEILLNNKRIKDSINVSDKMDFFEDIKKVGPGGHFLKQKSTRATFRSEEYFTTSLVDSSAYEEWRKNGAPGMYDNAHKKVKELLAQEPKNPLPLNVQKEMDEIVAEAARVLKE